MRTPRLPVVDWTDAPADLNGLVCSAERRNLVSARVPSHFNSPLQHVWLLLQRRLHTKTVQTSITDFHTRSQRYANANAKMLCLCIWWDQLHSVTSCWSAWNTLLWQAVHNCISVFCKQTARSTQQLRPYYFSQPKLVNLFIFPSLTVQHAPSQHSWCLATAMTV